MKITADQLRNLYLDFFKSKGHAVISGASLIPENDPTVLFTTAGMHPLVPYLMGKMPHPAGTRLTDVQKCVRTGDIDEVGDSAHLTFFEMLGNWSLNDYFKKEAIEWSFEFLTTKLGFSPDQLSVTVFAGEPGIPADEEAVAIWKSVGIPEERIYRLPREDNWWGPAGETGPCGPDTEMFIDTGKEKCGPDCRPGCHCGKYIEIWNDVFMQFNKTAEGKFAPTLPGVTPPFWSPRMNVAVRMWSATTREERTSSGVSNDALPESSLIFAMIGAKTSVS